jgi:hypothetical protein
MEDSLHLSILRSRVVDIAGCDKRNSGFATEAFIGGIDSASLLKFPERLDLKKVALSK